MSPSKRRARELIPARARAVAFRSGQRFLNRLGYDIVRWADAISLDEERRARLIDSLDVDLVLDVGANEGQFGERLRRAGYGGRIVSFEPLSKPFSALRERTAEDPEWDCRQRALGSSDGTAEIHVSGNVTSSSLLEMEDRHLQSAPESGYVGTEKIETAGLDTIWSEIAGTAEHAYLKLDVQGFELEVLRGAEQSLSKIVGVQAELSLVPLYRNAPTFRQLIDHLEQRGYRLAGLEGGHDDLKTGEMLQADGIFIRNPAS